MKTRLISFLLGLALVAGCASNQQNQPASSERPSQVKVLFSKPDRPFVELGTVSALKAQPDISQTWESVLRRQAASLGADAVVVDHNTLDNQDLPSVTATCIRYTQASQ